MLYEVAILEQPTTKAAEDGAVEKLIFGPKAVVAKDRDAAIVAAVAEAGIKTPRMEVLVRPFDPEEAEAD